MNRLIPIVLLWLSVCISAYAQPNQAKWGLTDNLNMISVKELNIFLSIPDIKNSKADMEIRLYSRGHPSGLVSMTGLVYKDSEWSATYYSRKGRRVDDPVDAVFPLNIGQIKNKKLDSVFSRLAMHNVFILPDQSQTSNPHVQLPYIILVKSNEQIRGYRFQNTSLVEDLDSQEFREYQAIIALFYYLNDGFPEKR